MVMSLAGSVEPHRRRNALNVIYLLHTENISVKVDGGLGVLDTDHGVIEYVLGRISRHFWLVVISS